MEQTIKALADLREHWAAQGHPNVSEIAKRANVARGTAHRYLSGETKGGTVETVRAIAIAMDRRDIADSIPYTGISAVSHTDDYIAEMVRQWDERTQQRMSEIEAKHKQEMDTLRADHREERQGWNEQLAVMRKQIHAVTIEKWAFAILFVISIAMHHYK